MVLCPKCGYNNDENAKFCEECGESFQDNVSNNKKKKSVIIIGLAFILITGISIGVFLLNDVKINKNQYSSLYQIQSHNLMICYLPGG